MRIVVRDSQAYVAAEIEILHLSVREWGVAFQSGMT
jgi:hypothetical protein